VQDGLVFLKTKYGIYELSSNNLFVLKLFVDSFLGG